MVMARKRYYGQLPMKAAEDKKKEMTEEKSVRVPYLPNETWLQVIAWIKRMELAKGVSLACDRFNAIAHKRMHERSSLFPPGDNTRRMRALQIDYKFVRQTDAKDPLWEAVMKAVIKGNAKRIGWPNSPMSKNIVGMEEINISFFDAKVFSFFEQIRPLLTKELHLEICSMDQRDVLAMEHILPLCSGPILSISLPIENIDQFSSKFPHHWAKCQLLEVNEEWISENEMRKLVKWLTERRTDGKPKLLEIDVWDQIGNEFSDLVKKHFFASSQRVSFLVRLPLQNAVEFREFNWRTNEQLTLNRIGDYGVLISRGPIGADQHGEEMAKGREKLLNGGPNEGVLVFCVNEIGNLDGIKKNWAEKRVNWTTTKRTERRHFN